MNVTGSESLYNDIQTVLQKIPLSQLIDPELSMIASGVSL